MSEIVACPKCNRNNGVHRVACIYCGAALPITKETELEKLPALRPMDETELGFNLICFPADSLTDAAARREIEIVARLSDAQIESVLAFDKPVPLVRTQSRADAEILYRRLLAVGVRTTILSDEEIAIATPPRRVRRLHPTATGAQMWSAEQTPLAWLAWDEISLVVFGTLRFRRLLTQEESNRRNDGREVKDLSEQSGDEAVIDFFGPSLEKHFRIRAGSFDYGCLGKRMRLLAAENYAQLGDWMVERAARAAVDRDFRQTSKFLELVWPSTKTVERQPLRRVGVGKVAAEVASSFDNETQLTRYARMQFLLRRKGLLD
jgi:hypothetical protein